MAQQPSPWERFKDRFITSAIHSPFGGGGLARAYYKAKGYSDQDINKAIERYDAEQAAKYKNAPTFQGQRNLKSLVTGDNKPKKFTDYFTPENIGRAAVDFGGSLLGGVDPTYVVAPGRNAVQRMTAQGLVQGGTSAARQAVEINTGQRKKFDKKKVAEDTLSGIAFQGAMEAGSKVLRGRKAPEHHDENMIIAPDGQPAGNEGGVRPMEPHEIARIMGDPEAAGGAPHQRRANRDRPQEVPVHEVLTTDEQNNILDSLPPANREWLEQQNNVSPFPTKDGIVEEAPSLNNARDAMDIASTNAPPPAPANDRGKASSQYTDEEWAKLSLSEKQAATSIENQRQQRKQQIETGTIAKPALPSPEAVQLAKARGVKSLDELTPEQWADVEIEAKSGRNIIKGRFKELFDDEDGALGYMDENGEPETPPVFQKLYDALNTGRKARTKQNELYGEERIKRNAELQKARMSTSGVEGFYAEKAKLKGDMPAADYAGLNGLEQQDIEDLFNHVKNHPNLGWMQSVSAREGLQKMLQGEVPTKTEMDLLSRTLPPDLMKAMLGQRGMLSKAKEVAGGVLNIPKALMASFDISAPLRQGVFMIGRKEFYKSLAPMVKAFASPKYEKSVREAIYSDPLFRQMQDSGLAVPKYEGKLQALADKEEAYMTNYAQKIPVAGIGVKASERAYNTFVYKLRADTFRSIYMAGKASGKKWNQDSLRDLSKYINTFTGRGDLGKLNNAAPLFNAVLFSPRLLKSRIDALRPGFYGDLDPYVRKEAIKSMITFGMTATSVLGLAKFAGAEVDPDIRKADGWKIKVGNTRYDILGGEQQLMRLYANLGEYGYNKGKEVLETGEIHMGNRERDAVDKAGTFLRNKESPDVSFAHDFATGKNAVGEDFNLKKGIVSRITPMVTQDAYDAVQDLKSQGVPVDDAVVKGIIKALPSIIGVGSTTYPEKEKAAPSPPKFEDFNSDFDNFDSFEKV